MQSSVVSTKTVVLAWAMIMIVWINDLGDARPMHADIIPTYRQYLEEKEQVAAELEKWLQVYGPKGTKKGFIPVTESRSSDQTEDLQQRLYMTKNQIKEAQKANPQAVLGTQGPFTLMTMEEFHEFLSNSHVSHANEQKASRLGPPKALSKDSIGTASPNALTTKDGNSDGTPSPKRVPTTKAPTVIAATRRLQDAENRQSIVDRGDDNGFKRLADAETLHPNQPYQRSTATVINTNWNFEDVSTADKTHIAQVSDGGDRKTGTWWERNRSHSWGTRDTSDFHAGSLKSESTSVPSSTPRSGSLRYEWTEPCSGNDCQASTTQTLIYSTSAPAPASLTNLLVPSALPPASVSVEKSSMAAANDSDPDAVDWSTSDCVSEPGLQGQCSSDWAFATVAALEAVQCIHNDNKKAPTYSKQQLVSCDKKNFGCSGGAPVYAMEYARDHGLCVESSYEYTSEEGGPAAACLETCTPLETGIAAIDAIETGDESALLHVVKQQPVIASVISSTPAWKQYISGVITACPTADVDHAVLVVGYDATTIKIKNSWGTDWGENGYVRISRSSAEMGTCAVLTEMSYPTLAY